MHRTSIGLVAKYPKPISSVKGTAFFDVSLGAIRPQEEQAEDSVPAFGQLTYGNEYAMLFVGANAEVGLLAVHLSHNLSVSLK